MLYIEEVVSFSISSLENGGTSLTGSNGLGWTFPYLLWMVKVGPIGGNYNMSHLTPIIEGKLEGHS